MGDGSEMSDETCRATLEIVNRLGLHARAAVLFVQAATQFDAKVTVTKDDQSVDGRSIMGVMMLAAEEGSTIRVRADGSDELAAIEALRGLVDGKFGGEP